MNAQDRPPVPVIANEAFGSYQEEAAMSEEASVYMCQTTDSAKGDASDAPSELLQSGALKDAMILGAAGWSYDPMAGSWYFALNERAMPPYRKQVHVDAILDLDANGHLAGVEFLKAILPPPGRQDEVARSASDASHPDVRQLDTNELRNAVLEEAATAASARAQQWKEGAELLVSEKQYASARLSEACAETASIIASDIRALKTEKQGGSNV